MDDADKVIKRFKKNFDKADVSYGPITETDKDGKKDHKLDEKEMTLMVQRMENEDMETVVEELIKKADDNKDGKLSLNEIIKNVKALKGRMQLFMGECCRRCSHRKTKARLHDLTQFIIFIPYPHAVLF